MDLVMKTLLVLCAFYSFPSGFLSLGNTVESVQLVTRIIRDEATCTCNNNESELFRVVYRQLVL